MTNQNNPAFQYRYATPYPQEKPAAPAPSVDVDVEEPTLVSARFQDLPGPQVKPTNPKDAAATFRIPLGLLSPLAKAHWSLAQYAGRLKYGAWNWRHSGVCASVYVNAMGRHLDAWVSGEEADPVDGTHHLGNVMACCAILIEAEAQGKLVDDRPPVVGIRATYAKLEGLMKELYEKYKDAKPRNYTIGDSQGEKP